MGSTERRNEILRRLCRRGRDTIANLAAEFGVSERTIRRDIDALSSTEPIYTQTGIYIGGIYIMKGYNVNRMYMTEEELLLLKKLYLNAQCQGILNQREVHLIEGIMENYSKPKN